ncbi:MAG TPA: extracellular solute-binding protein, partial [bacterium]|nr:extracellular solute-binding protein [bacterium]
MKKTVVFFFIFTISFFLSAQKTDVTIWHSYRGSEQTALEELKDKFNELNNNFNVVLLSVPYDAFANKLTNAIPRGNGPDAFIFAHERIGDWAESSIIRPLEIQTVENLRPDTIPSTLEALKYKGKYWGYPLSFKSVVLFYRTDLVKKVPAGTSEMIELAKKLTNSEKGNYGLAFEAASVYFSAPFIYGFDGGFCFEEGKTKKTGDACLNNDGNIAALDFIGNLVNGLKIVPQEATSALVTQLFNDGKAAMVINGPWFLGEIRKDVPFDVAVLPTVSQTGNVLKPFLTVESYLIAEHPTVNVSGAKAFGEFITSFDGAKVRAVTGRQSVSTKSVYTDPDIANDNILNTFRVQAEIAVPMSNDPKMRMVWEPFAGALRKVLRGAESSKTALDSAQTQFEIFSRPLPKAKSPVIFVVILLIAGLIGLLILVSQIRKYKFFQGVKNSPTPYLYLFPAMFSMLLLVFVPFTVGTAVAFFAHRSGEYQFVGFSNFISILLSKDFPITNPLSFYFTLAVTVMWTAVNVFLHVSIGLILALMLREPWLKMKGFYRMLLIIP